MAARAAVRHHAGVPAPTPLSPPAEAFALAALAALPDTGMLVLDRNLRVLAAEGGAFRRTGWDPETFTGRCLEDVLPMQAYAPLASRYRAALDGRAERFRYVTEVTRRSYDVEALPLPAESSPAKVMVLMREVPG
jgi:PAS domain-containing protein